MTTDTASDDKTVVKFKVGDRVRVVMGSALAGSYIASIVGKTGTVREAEAAHVIVQLDGWALKDCILVDCIEPLESADEQKRDPNERRLFLEEVPYGGEWRSFKIVEQSHTGSIFVPANDGVYAHDGYTLLALYDGLRVPTGVLEGITGTWLQPGRSGVVSRAAAPKMIAAVKAYGRRYGASGVKELEASAVGRYVPERATSAQPSVNGHYVETRGDIPSKDKAQLLAGIVKLLDELQREATFLGSEKDEHTRQVRVLTVSERIGAVQCAAEKVWCIQRIAGAVDITRAPLAYRDMRTFVFALRDEAKMHGACRNCIQHSPCPHYEKANDIKREIVRMVAGELSKTDSDRRSK